MTIEQHRRSVLARAVAGTLYHAKEGDAGGGAPPKPETPPPNPKPDEQPKPAAGLTEEQVQQRIDAALKAERDAQAKSAAKAKEDAEAEESRKRGEFEQIAAKEREKREAAEAERDEAARRAQLAEVNVKLRDHLVEKHKDYLANAADIMLHVEKKLAADADDAAVSKLIESESKSFVERTPRGDGKPAGGAPTRLGTRNVGAPPAPATNKPRHPRSNAFNTPASRF